MTEKEGIVKSKEQILKDYNVVMFYLGVSFGVIICSIASIVIDALDGKLQAIIPSLIGIFIGLVLGSSEAKKKAEKERAVLNSMS